MIFIIRGGNDSLETDVKSIATREIRRLEAKGHEVKVEEHPKTNNPLPKTKAGTPQG